MIMLEYGIASGPFPSINAYYPYNLYQMMAILDLESQVVYSSRFFSCQIFTATQYSHMFIHHAEFPPKPSLAL